MDTTKLLSLLRTSISSKSLFKGKLIHQKVVTLGLQNNIALCKNLINLYFSCHYYHYAKLIFNTLEDSLDLSLWNGIMAAYAKNYMFTEALEIFDRLVLHAFLKPDNYTYPSVLKACGGLGRVQYGNMLHTQLIKTGFVLDVVVSSSLVGMYAKCNKLNYAIKVFDKMSERDVASWNTVISCYYQEGQAEKALELFGKMRDSGFEPNSVTLTTVISSCSRLFDLERGKEIHEKFMKDGIVFDSYVGSALVDMYGKCGCLEMARDVFEQIPVKSVVTWNAMIAGYGAKGDSKSCIQLFRRMNEEGVKPTLTTLSCILMSCSRSAKLEHGKFMHGYLIRNKVKADIFINGSLIDLYFKCGHVSAAENVFDRMSKTNVVSWNVMISGYVTVGDYFKSLAIYGKMKESGVNPDAVTFTSVLASCSQLAALEKGKEIHKCIVESELETNEIVMGALLNMYAKCGAVDEALNVFNQLPERDLVSWTSMITAYGSHGQAAKALKLFDEMRKSNTKPDSVTFLAILSACSHAGLVDEGCHYFSQMTFEYNLKPKIEHYLCLIDLLGRAGRLHEAYDILRSTTEIEDVGLLSTLFSACCLHRNTELGEKIAKLLIEKDPDDPSTYIVLSNMYASIKKWDEVRKLRLKMKERRLKKNPGCSWIEIGEMIQPFYVEDKMHPQAEMVYECLAILSSHMEKEELQPS
ncbi:pentatricopeptide repeat-containing protein At5g27110-like [Mangifera indica]|uniref:pentatricopeptide repeat-containing protein At5g27110-like n=1 Tax=Mangifera indica TaxID=29780 RepID=UPI001CFB4F52|nr:pentatricopeptide repeat-containing protein At5g27110-like [Mangifera indica]